MKEINDRDQQNLIFLDERISLDYYIDIELKEKTLYEILMNLDSFVLNPLFELNHLIVSILNIHQLNSHFSKLNLLYVHLMNEDFHVIQYEKMILMMYEVTINHVVLHYRLKSI